MGLRVAIQMDHVDSIDINSDSTFVLAMEAQERGHILFHYGPESLSLDQGRVVAMAEEMSVSREHGNHHGLGETRELDLSQVDVVLMRQDPPFDMAYITATHILDHIHPKTLVVNDPTHVRNAPEKLFVTDFPDLMPPTLITRDPARVVAFRNEHKDIVVKPLYGNGGVGVFHIMPGDENLNSLLEMFAGTSSEPVMVQQYLPAVRDGDKRIILVDGEAVGAINRVPAKGEARSNMHVGGQAFASGMNDRDMEICRRIGPALKERGLIFVGIDVIGGLLTEINVTSPTGIQEIAEYDDTHLEKNIWDAIERKLG
jgi:glutathione synthase